MTELNYKGLSKILTPYFHNTFMQPSVARLARSKSLLGCIQGWFEKSESLRVVRAVMGARAKP